LSKDGLFRPHSWVWDIKESRIVETTEPRVVYFGVTEKHSDKEVNGGPIRNWATLMMRRTIEAQDEVTP